MSSSRHRFLLTPVLVLTSVAGTVWAQQPLGELYATDARVKGAVILAGSGTSVVSGSAIQAGAQTATLKLERGGNLLVCPGTNLSVTASQNGRSLLLSVSSGNLELDYPLGASADSLLTPDFRIVLPGPGRLHAAVRITPQGDTCVQTLSSNSTAITVYETIGDETYQVKDNEAVLFRGGHIKGALPASQPCGCPAPRRPAARTEVAKTSSPPPAQTEVAKAPAAQAGIATAPALTPTRESEKKTDTAALPITPSADEHITMEAPFVYHGDDPYPNLTANVATLKIENNRMLQLDPVVLPPNAKQPQPAPKPAETASAKPEKKHGFFASVGSFFASIFGK